MPGMSGKKLGQQIKSDRPDIKILFISGYTDEILSGADNPDKEIYFLQKPFLPDHFLAVIRKILDGEEPADAK